MYFDPVNYNGIMYLNYFSLPSFLQSLKAVPEMHENNSDLGIVVREDHSITLKRSWKQINFTHGKQSITYFYKYWNVHFAMHLMDFAHGY